MARPRTGRQTPAEYQRRYRERKKAQQALAQTNWMLDARLTDAIREEAKSRGIRESQLAAEILERWYEARFGGPLPSLAVLAFLLIVFLAAAEKDRSWRKFFLSMQWTLTIYFLLATTVHPWYITTLVMIAVVTGYQYPIVWSLFIALSYSTYQSAPYQENLWFVAFEYLMVLSVMFFEVYTNFRKKLV